MEEKQQFLFQNVNCSANASIQLENFPQHVKIKILFLFLQHIACIQESGTGLKQLKLKHEALKLHQNMNWSFVKQLKELGFLILVRNWLWYLMQMMPEDTHTHTQTTDNWQ